MLDESTDGVAARLLGRSLNRRAVLLRGAALGLSIPAASALLAACGGDDDDDDDATPTTAAGATPGAGTTPTAGQAATTPTTGTNPTAAPLPTPFPTATLAPTPEGGIDREKVGGTLIHASTSDAESLDPIFDNYFSTVLLRLMYDNLLRYNSSNEIEPSLAESYEITDDGLQYSFTLRTGLLFHDGTPVAADSVKASFERLVDPAQESPVAIEAAGLTEVVIVDDLNVTMALPEPFSPFLDKLCEEPFHVISAAAIEQFGADLKSNPVGAGPYTLKEWTVGEQIVLAAFADYQDFASDHTNKGAPYFEEYIWRIIPDVQTQLAALESGEVSRMDSLPPEQVSRLEDNDDITLFRQEQSTGTAFLEFTLVDNAGTLGFKPPLDDDRVRQAIAYAVNRDEIVEALFQGQAVPNYQLIPTSSWGYDPAGDLSPRYDPEMAKQLLEEAGWTGEGTRQKDGEPLKLLYWAIDTGEFPRIAQLLQAQWKDVGIEIEIETYEPGTFYDTVGEATHHLDADQWHYSDPDFLYAMMTWGGAQLGIYNTYNPAADAAIAKARATTDRDERKAAYQEASKHLLDDLMVIPLFGDLITYGVRSEVRDVKPAAFGAIDMHDAYIEQ